MILYSIIPPEVVFQGSTYTDEMKFIEAEYKGEKIMVTQMADKSYEIARLLSTCPKTFLNPAYQPGNRIDAKDLCINPINRA